MDQSLRRRTLQSVPSPNPDSGAGSPGQAVPSGVAQGRGFDQVIRGTLVAAWFIVCITCIAVTQFLGAPLYFINKDYYYAYMALTKQSFGVVVITTTQWFSPTVVRTSGDMSVKGQLRRNANGQLETTFPERLVMIANHQLYTDWLYLWWIAYTSRMHGHIFIILKESMKYVPVIGPGMMFYGFVFLARKFTSDKPRLEHRLQKLKSRHSGPMSGAADLDPMWLMIFPEGTNLSANTRKGSKSWAEKNNIPDMRHQLLPRSTGLLFCLQQLGDTIEWIYDCTVSYEGGPVGGYASETFGLRSTYFQGRPPKSVNMYWRRFEVSKLPLQSVPDFEAWLGARWKEKDELLEQFKQTGRFPPSENDLADGAKEQPGYIETEITLDHWYEIGQIFVVLASFALAIDVATKISKLLLSLLQRK